MTLGSRFAIFEPWIWRRLGPVPACYNYMEAYWMEKFSHHFLSVYSCKRRTNSEVECFHWVLLRKMVVRHPNFWTFLYKLKIMARSYLLELNQLETGEPTRKRRSKTSEATDRQIRGAELLYSEKRLTMEEFLTRISHSTESSFKRMEVRIVPNDDNENKENVPDTKSDDEDIADLDCSEDLEEEFSLCAGCGDMLCLVCGGLKYCKYCGEYFCEKDSI